MSRARLDAATVRQAAQGRWSSILPALNIVVPSHAKRHGPCPVCGGKDRFRFDNRDGLGTWFCNQCVPHAGDGITLVMKAHACRFPEALTAVGGILGLDPSQSAKPRPPVPPPPVRMDRCALAFRCELGALDRRIRSTRVLAAIPPITGDDLSDEVRDRLMEAVASAHADVEQAERLEYLADLLRAKDFEERNRR